MSGVTIVSELLQAHAPLMIDVPAGSMKAGRLPDGVALPALLLRSVSRNERQTLKRRGTVRVTERVSVTVRGAAYRTPGALLKLVRDASVGKTGTIAGFRNVAVLAAGTGPDVLGPADSFERAQDLHVTFDEPA